MFPNVDLVVLTRTSEPLQREVERGISSQHETQIILHRVVGRARSADRCRWETIARARNEGRRCGTAPWLMFLDDDVVLAPRCVFTLVRKLSQRPMYGALAADYSGECREGQVARHVTMGATLFRREVLEQIRFRWRDDRCECQCCCDDLRRLRWAIDYCSYAKARHLSKEEISENSAANQNVGNESLVTCMCVTRGRIPMLRRSTQCFLNQTYRNRELVVVYESDDEATRQFLAGLRESSIYPVEVPAVPRQTLGSLRNIALQAGTGKYVAQWDDDDWYSPARLAEQMRAIRQTGNRGCLLARWTLYDCLTKRAYVSNVRPWEGSIVVERAILPPYPDLARREDTPVVDELTRRGQLVMLDRPELYIYTHHGMNTWDRHHWEQILRCSQPLGEETSRMVAALIGIERHGAAQIQTFMSAAI